MEITIKLSSNHGEYRCQLVKGPTVMFQMPPLRMQGGVDLDFFGSEVDFLTEFSGCYTPGQALEVFGRAYDSVLARYGWDNMKGGQHASDDR